MKFIVITGGVMSGIGKGITASSIGVILKNYNQNVTSIKIDPYLNLDAGTMSPFEHGECYVLEDGGEVDLDLGNYERFLGITLTKDHNITMGKIYKNVLEKEREGKYLGKTVQVIPHITDHIIEWILKTSEKIVYKSEKPNICIIELGGTIGDIESMPFIEALRQLAYRLGHENIMFVHVSYIPVLKISNEEKTKPTQHSIQTLRSLGIQPDILCLRCEKNLSTNLINKLQNYCQVDTIIPVIDVSNIYRVPLVFNDYNIINCIKKQLKLDIQNIRLLDQWNILATNLDINNNEKIITIVGKYTGLHDSYLSLTHGIKHAALHLNIFPKIQFIESTLLEQNDTNAWSELKSSDAIIIPGGFGVRGTEGMIIAIKYSRENNIPILGICFGMQLQVIEIARHLTKIDKATSQEFYENGKHIIIKMDELENTMGGTMRLGLRETILDINSLVYKLYGKEMINERHRHRYEVNPEYISILESIGLIFSGTSEKRMEIIELKNHIYFTGCQFHPEYQTYPDKPHPLFYGLLSNMI